MREERKQGLAFRSQTKPRGSVEAVERVGEGEEVEVEVAVVVVVVGVEVRSALDVLAAGCGMVEREEEEGPRRGVTSILLSMVVVDAERSGGSTRRA